MPSSPYGRPISRRRFLEMGSAACAAFALSCSGNGTDGPNGGGPHLGGGPVPFSDPVADPRGVIDLPPSFRYEVISESGTKMTTGARVPGQPDGMGAFAGPNGTTMLVRNHELKLDDQRGFVAGSNPYSDGEPGGTLAVVVDAAGRKLDEFVSSSGSRTNCAGGRTPWGTWLTCEEATSSDHGYVFEVDPREPENQLSAMPIAAMGRFAHEAAGVDPRTGFVYLTEDDYSGASEGDPSSGLKASFLYRYIPDDTSPRPGSLQKGGRLQALVIAEGSDDADQHELRTRLGARWVDVDQVDPHAAAMAGGAVRFNRLEGADFAAGSFWFADTLGGEHRKGQIFRYLPETEALELWYESEDATNIESPDNITVTPWGDLWFAEDETKSTSGDSVNRMMGVTPEGTAYPFGICRLGGAEFAGPCFSPDGGTFFVNIQSAGLTLSIRGSFPRPNPARVRRLGFAPARHRFAPRISDRVLEAARELNLSPLEAAAYDRLGIPLA